MIIKDFINLINEDDVIDQYKNCTFLKFKKNDYQFKFKN